MGRLQEAAEQHEQALVLDRDSGNRVNESYNLRYVGETYHALGRSAEALDGHRQALDLARATGARSAEIQALAEAAAAGT